MLFVSVAQLSLLRDRNTWSRGLIGAHAERILRAPKTTIRMVYNESNSCLGCARYSFARGTRRGCYSNGPSMASRCRKEQKFLGRENMLGSERFLQLDFPVSRGREKSKAISNRWNAGLYFVRALSASRLKQFAGANDDRAS